MYQDTIKFDKKKIESILINEHKFINSLFSVLAFPRHYNEEDDEVETQEIQRRPKLHNKKTSRAASLLELQTRISTLRKSKATYREKIQKKNLKSRLTKKLKRDRRNANKKLISIQKLEDKAIKSEDQETTNKPVFNREDKMVFSKIDFTGLGDQKQKRSETNPKKLLEKVQHANEKIEQLKAKGDVEKALLMKEKSSWKNALAKSQGDKIRDDPVLLKKSIQKLEQRKRSSKKKWEAREEGVEKAKQERQSKRTKNIEKRKKEKKLTKLKKAAKRGKIIPGF